jgi:hypothetical protein
LNEYREYGQERYGDTGLGICKPFENQVNGSKSIECAHTGAVRTLDSRVIRVNSERVDIGSGHIMESLLTQPCRN